MAIAVAPPTLETGQTIEELPLASIAPAPDNPRRNLGDLDELAASMSELGMIQPLVVTPRQGKWMVVCGHRRHAAAKLAKLETAPAIIRDLDEPQRIKAMLIENCQREGLATIEEARAYKALVELGLTQRQIAGSVGKTQSHISKRLQLLELPEKVVDQVDSGGIVISEALELAALSEHPKRMQRVIDRPSWQTIAYAVAQEKAAIELDARVAKSREQLKARGVTPVKLGTYGDAKPPAKVLGKGWNQVDIAVKTHEGLPCHAVGINPRTGEIVALCTSPDNHASQRVQETARKLSAAEKRERKEQEQLEAAAELRLEFIAHIASGKVTKDDLVEISLYALFTPDYYEPFEWACRMLKVPLPAPIVNARNAETVAEAERELRDLYVDVDPMDAMTALSVYSGQSAVSQLRAAFALAACVIESEACRSRWSVWGPAARALFNVLERHGYETTPVEAKQLEQKAAS